MSIVGATIAAILGHSPATFAGVQADRPHRRSSPGEAPQGLSASDWSSIRAAYDANRHAAFDVDGGYQARNPGQQWVTRFDGRGFTVQPDAGDWTWGLELVRYGFTGKERTIATPSCVSAEGQRVMYDWDATLQEWYVNDARGLEHGYTVLERPTRDVSSDQGPLTFTLAIRGGLCAEVQDGGRSVRFTNGDRAAVLTYTGLTVVDAEGQNLPAYFEQVTEGLRLSIDEHGARYPLTIDPLTQQAYLKASNTDAGDDFGFSVSVSGDTVVVGAVFEDSNATGVNGDQSSHGATDSGAAYVFVRTASGWSQQAYLKASNTEADDRFGIAVSVSGDTLVVGAIWEDSSTTGVNGDQTDNSGLEAGAAYVFVRSGTSWSQEAYLKASNTETDDFFGFSVSASGDTVVVGAYKEASNATGVDGDQTNNSAAGAGAAYVFVRSGTSWTQQAYLKASNTDDCSTICIGENFGRSVSVSSDTVVVGADKEASNATGVDGDPNDDSASFAGAAYVFVRNLGTWSEEAYLKASNTEANDFFGFSVSASGDTVVVGSLAEDSNAIGVNGGQSDNSAASAGAAYVFERRDSLPRWSQRFYLKASNTNLGDNFGRSVSVSGATVVVGAPGEDSNAIGVDGGQSDNSAASAGAAYVFGPLEPLTFCSGKTNSLGCVPFLTATGVPRASSTAVFQVQANDMIPGEAGFLLYSFKKANLNFHGGKLCVKAPIERLLPPKLAAGTGNPPCAGILKRDFNATILAGGNPLLTVGQTVFAQWRQRDPADPAGFGDSLTNGISFTIAP